MSLLKLALLVTLHLRVCATISHQIVSHFRSQVCFLLIPFLEIRWLLTLGTAVYMAAAKTDISGGYTVSIDGQAPVAIDGFSGTSSTPNCGFAWSSFDLGNTAHSVTVNLTGQSSQATFDGASASSFELDGFTWDLTPSVFISCWCLLVRITQVATSVVSSGNSRFISNFAICIGVSFILLATLHRL